MEVRLHTVNGEDGTDTFLDLGELKTWAGCRYISFHESIWRIFEFATNFISHKVQRLSVHLPNEQVFTEKNMEEIAQAEAHHLNSIV